MADQKTLKDMSKLLRLIYPLLLSYESRQISISECSLTLATYLDEYREEINHYIRLGNFSPELKAIIFRIKRCGIKNDLIKALEVKEQLNLKDSEKANEALNRLKKEYGSEDKDIQKLETALKNMRVLK